MDPWGRGPFIRTFETGLVFWFRAWNRLEGHILLISGTSRCSLGNEHFGASCG
jgi:hypothetical protein